MKEPITPYKQIVIIGPDTPSDGIKYIRNAWYQTGLMDGIDYIILGDGINSVSQAQIDEALKHTNESTHIHYWGHGIAKSGNHFINLTGKLESTEAVLERNIDAPGIRHIWSCYGGAVKTPNTILHSSDKHSTLIPMNSASIARVGIFCQQFEEQHNRSPNVYEVVMFCMLSSPETLKYSDYKVQAPVKPVGGKGVKRYLERKVNSFLDWEKNREMEAINVLSTMGLLPIHDAYQASPMQSAQATSLETFKAHSPRELDEQADIRQHLDHQRSSFLEWHKSLGGGKDLVSPSELLSDRIALDYLGQALVKAVGRASSKHTLEYAKQYLELGADPDYALIEGTTSLYLATVNGREDVADLLLKSGADVNLPDNFGVAPLRCACERGHGNIVTLLLKNDANINQIDKAGATPLYAACEGGFNDIVKQLLSHKADINQGLYSAFTPLMVAVLAGNENVVDTVLQHPAADLQYLKKYSDRNAARVFCKQNRIDIPQKHIQYLGKSALDMARECSHDAIADKIKDRIAFLKQIEPLPQAARMNVLNHGQDKFLEVRDQVVQCLPQKGKTSSNAVDTIMAKIYSPPPKVQGEGKRAEALRRKNPLYYDPLSGDIHRREGWKMKVEALVKAELSTSLRR